MEEQNEENVLIVDEPENNNQILIEPQQDPNDNKEEKEDDSHKNIVMNEDDIDDEQKDINEIKENENEENKPKSKEEIKKNFLKTIPMYIYQAKVLEMNPVNLIVYFLKGTLIEKKIVRSFTDLEVFRETLKNAWPCTYVPNFPLRNESTEDNEKIISEEKKMKLLNHFLKQISESKYLSECEITKTFLSSSVDYANAAAKTRKETVIDLSEKYLATFKDYVYDQSEIDKKNNFIKTFVKTLQTTLSRFLLFGENLLKEMFNIKREQNTINFVIDMFSELEQALPNKKKRLTNLKKDVKPIYSVSNIYIFINLLINYKTKCSNHILNCIYSI